MTKFATLIAGAGLMLAGAAGTAHADVHFVNVASRPVIFTMRCGGSVETYRWVVGVNRTLNVSCNNGASEALVRLYTNDGAVISRVVDDGATYEVGFNRRGEASIAGPM
jgi:hypothetical protein